MPERPRAGQELAFTSLQAPIPGGDSYLKLPDFLKAALVRGNGEQQERPEHCLAFEDSWSYRVLAEKS